MKQITAIVDKDDASEVEEALVAEGFLLTRLSTTGGFLKKGNTTFVCAVEDDRLERAIAIISEHCRQRTTMVAAIGNFEGGAPINQTLPVEIAIGGATVIVTEIERFLKL